MDLTGKRMVIFGCGYLGSRVASQALARGMNVVALTRNSSQADRLRKMGVQQVIIADLDGLDWQSAINPRQDLVLNCVSSAGGGWDGYRQSYLEGMRSVLRWASAGSVGTLIFTSSTSVYAQDNEAWISETDPAEGSSEGGRILREAEKLLEPPSAGVGRAFVLRLGGIYGPGRHHLLTRALADFVAEDGDDVFLNPIQVDDAVAAIWSAAAGESAAGGGIFNIVDDAPTRKGEIVRYLHERVNELGLAKDSPISASPPGRRRVGPRPNRRISNRKARDILDWKPAFAEYRSGYESLLRSQISGAKE